MSREMRGSASACSNIALIKYWGKADFSDNVPLNDSVSMTLSDAITTTTVIWDGSLSQDEIYLDGERILDGRGVRISRYLDRIRADYYRMPARVASMNSFPAGTGIASSASGFAALATAAFAAMGEDMPSRAEMTRWARRGSGSACRSIHGGFVEWIAGKDDATSYAHQLAGQDFWDLRDLVVLVSEAPKVISSSEGHKIASRHPFMAARQELLPSRMLATKGAIAARDLPTLGALIEQEALEMHGIMMSGQPAALYMEGGTMQLLHAIRSWREEDGLPVFFTLDAGPNVHVLCEGKDAAAVRERIERLAPTLRILENRAGPGVRVHDEHLL